MALYHATDGPNWSIDYNWGEDCDVCQWYGITCNGAGQITAIDLANNRLNGQLPIQIGDFSSLLHLNLERNTLSGNPPLEIGNLTNLQTLDLSSNDFTGPIPIGISSLNNLQTLHLGFNQFSGEIPIFLATLSELEKLYLVSNLLTGQIPMQMGNLAKLTLLELDFNQLTGSIPTSLANLQALTVLSLGSNQLTGQIPVELGNLDKLQVLILVENNLTGQIPSSLGDMSDLNQVSLSLNSLTGGIPASIAYLPNLVHFRVDDNNLDGCLSPDFQNFCNAGIYFTYFDNPCFYSEPFSAFCNGAPCVFNDYTLQADPTSICRGNSTMIIATGGTSYQWSTGETSASITVIPLVDTWYYLDLTTPAGCQRSDSILITVRDNPVATASGTDVTIPGGSDGTASVVASGGTLPYAYLWNTGATSTTILALSAGIYHVTVTDANGCEDRATVEVAEPSCPVAGTPCDDGDPTTFDDVEDGNCHCAGTPCPTISVNLTTTDVTCYGAGDGTAAVDPSGGTAPYTVAWSNGSSAAAIADLAPGTYGVTVTDDHNCMTDLDVITIGEPAELTSSIQSTPESAHGLNDGAADLTVSGGTAPYSFLWSNAATSEDLTGLMGQGSLYSVVVTDAHGCTAYDTTVIQTNCPVAGTPCDDGDPATFDDVEDGSCHCAGTPCPTISVNLTTTDVTCYGAGDGTAAVNPSGGTAPYTVAWSNGSSAAAVADLAPGTYGVTVTDDHNCMTVLDVITIGEPTELTSSIQSTPESAPGLSDGAADLTVSGGTAPYSFLWSNAATSEDLTGLMGQGSLYSVVVTDAHGCTAHDTTVIQTNCPVVGTPCDDGDPTTFDDVEDGSCHCAGTPCPTISVNLTTTDVTCYGAGDGTAAVNPSGGTAPYAVTWSNGSSTAAIADLAPGTYGVTVTDDHNCMTVLDVITIGEPAELTSSIQSTPESAPGLNDGAADLTVSGGTAPYSFLWSNAATSEDLTGLMGQGSLYSVVVTDARGCTAYDTTVIQTNCPVAGTPCDDGDPTTFDDVEDGNCHCAGTPCPTISVNLTTTDVTCYGAGDGTAAVNPSGGTAPYAVAWSNGSSAAAIADLAPGTYGVTVTDDHNCMTVLDVITIGEPAELTSSIQSTPESAPGLNDGAADLTVSGGTAPYSFLWSNAATSEDLTGLMGQGSLYSVVITDAHGCTAYDTTVIQTNCPAAGTPCDDGDPATFDDVEDGNCHCAGTPCPTISVNLTTTDVTCYGAGDGTAAVNPSGGTAPYAVTWSNGSSTAAIADLAPGTYGVTVTDDHNCMTVLDVITIGEPAEFTSSIQSTPESAPGLNDGAADLTVSGGTAPYSFLWSNAATSEDLTGLMGQGSLYSVVVTDAHGCTAHDTTVIQTNCPVAGTPCDDGDPTTFDDVENGSCHCAGTPCPTITLNLTTTDVTCYGAGDGTAAVNPSGGTAPYAVAWSNGSSTAAIADLAPGTYGVTVTDDHNCMTVLDVITIGEPAAITIATNSQDESISGALDGAITVMVVGGVPPYMFLWSHGSSSKDLTGLAGNGQEFVVTVTDAHGCEASTSATVITGCLPEGTECDDADSQTFNDQQDGHCICSGTPCPAITIDMSITQVTCHGAQDGAVAIEASGGLAPYSYEWSTGMVGASIDHLSAGTYKVTVSDANQCDESITNIIIGEPPPLQISIETLDESMPGANDGEILLSVDGGSAPYHFLWSNGMVAQNLTGLKGSQYEVTITDDNGCTALDTALVHVGCAPKGMPCDDGDDNTAFDQEDGQCHCEGITCLEGLSIATDSLAIAGSDPTDCEADGNIEILGVTTGSSLQWSVDGGVTYQESPLFMNLPPGTYSMYVRDTIGGCEFFVGEINLGDQLATIDDLKYLDPTDCNVADGAIALKKPDGDLEIALAAGGPWYPSQIINLVEGTYQVYGRRLSNHCVYLIIDELHLGQPMDDSILVSVTDASTCGSGLGSISLFPSSDDISYSINSGQNWYERDQQFEVSPGIYQVLIRDSLGCIKDLGQELEVKLLERPFFDDILVTDASTCVSPDGAFSFSEPNMDVEISVDQGMSWSQRQSVQGLLPGDYEILVRELGTGCTDTLNIVIGGQLHDLTLDSLVLAPSCHGGADGFIRIAVVDSVDAYSYLWTTGDTLDQIGSLSAGHYGLRVVSRSSGCLRDFDFFLSQPDPLGFELPSIDSLTLCQGESYHLAIPDTTLYYIWSKDGNPVDVGPELTVTGPATYMVTAVDTQGCESYDSLQVSYSESVFHANFLMASMGVVGTPITAIEVSWPIPEIVEWDIVGGEMLDLEFNQATFQFADVGTHTLILRATNGSCMSVVEKVIEIVADASLLDTNAVINSSSIKSASIYPNPNSGNFNLLVQLEKASIIQTRIYSEQGILVFADQTASTDTYSANIDLGTVMPGVYSILIQTADAWTSLNVVIE